MTVDAPILVIPEDARTEELVRLSGTGGLGPSMLAGSWAVVERTSKLQTNMIPSKERTICCPFIDAWFLSTVLSFRQNSGMISGRIGEREGEVLVLDPGTSWDSTRPILADVREMCKFGSLSLAVERHLGDVMLGRCRKVRSLDAIEMTEGDGMLRMAGLVAKGGGASWRIALGRHWICGLGAA